MQEKAFLLAQKWILNNYRVFQRTGAMWEKYDVVGNVPEVGAGGEYAVQAASLREEVLNTGSPLLGIRVDKRGYSGFVNDIC